MELNGIRFVNSPIPQKVDSEAAELAESEK